jgi:hypothetical protein
MNYNNILIICILIVIIIGCFIFLKANNFGMKPPEVNCIDTECPDAKFPDIKCPDIKCPDVKCPDAKCPDVKCSDAKCPDAKCPDIKCLETNYTETKCPVIKCPELKCDSTINDILNKIMDIDINADTEHNYNETPNTVFLGTDNAGNNAGINASSNVTINECKKICNRNNNCQGFSFKGSENEKGDCWFRSAIHSLSDNKYVSFEKKNKPINKPINGFNEYYYHNTIGEVLNNQEGTIIDCQKTCLNTPECKGFKIGTNSYPNKKGNCAFLKTLNGDPIPQDGIISYIKKN